MALQHNAWVKIERYIDYYNNECMKQKLAGLSPVKYRT
ncbi:IS3 family transposase [Lysinibacillus sphaericus]